MIGVILYFHAPSYFLQQVKPKPILIKQKEFFSGYG